MSTEGSKEGGSQRRLNDDDLKVLLNHYDKDRDNKLSDDELDEIIKQYKNKSIESVDPEVAKILAKFDSNKDGNIDAKELHELVKEIKTTDSYLRVAGYTALLTRMFRYLAFTSDFGEALRPVVSKTAVNASYGIAIGYCFVDVGWEAHKLHKRNYISEKGHHMSMTQLIVERSTFQALASVLVPFTIIHSAVDLAKKYFNRIKRFTKWGPSIVGLSVIPLLPLYLDEPIEHGKCYSIPLFCYILFTHLFQVLNIALSIMVHSKRKYISKINTYN
jgi:fission process protein 1